MSQRTLVLDRFGFASQFECCGLNGPTDWEKLPHSCCHDIEDSDTCTLDKAFLIGCLPQAETQLPKIGRKLAFVSLGAAGVELLGFVFGCIVSNSVRNEKRRGHY